MGAKGHKADSPRGSSSRRPGVRGKVHGHMHTRKSASHKHGAGDTHSGGGMSSRPTKKI